MNRSHPPHDDKAEVIHVEDGVHEADEHMGKQFANDAEGNLLHVDEAASKRLTRKVSFGYHLSVGDRRESPAKMPHLPDGPLRRTDCRDPIPVCLYRPGQHRYASPV
jgi:hypothetical protein